VADHPLDALERELLQAAQRQITATAAATAARPRPRRRRTLGLGVVVASLVAAGAAWAATSLTSTGSPVPYRHGTPQPGRDLGTPVPGS
jgi:ferric-dicitrate binding protein FerR (iron transport regulator)